MILDHLDNWKRYAGLNRRFAKAFEFLQRQDLADLPPGRHALDGDRLYVVVVRADGMGRNKATLEAHRKYIDIQFCLRGTDEIGWKPVAHCTPDEKDFDEAKDGATFTDKPEAWVTTAAGTFGIFFPTDAHAPLGGTGGLHKIIVKIAEKG
ncbi:MAG: YhcH/YjgK/YiaL family protein [Phycisphaerae bacterium]|jgi:YhcH/YjgK/YiaL family protein|nr:YhcH/YjgK/YiaL family protein [Phycisphaerae bacterium]MDP7637367.1 YhcH/YjgK/YiaL family protein [Phycisphaerae bacterium]